MFELKPFRKRGKQELDEWDNFFDAIRSSFMGDANSLFNEFKTDVKENEDEYLVQSELPGLSKDDINIELSNDYLTIKVEQEQEEKKEEENFIRRERRSGSYQRRFRFKNVKEDEIEANYENGILEIILPKKEKGNEDKRIIDIE